MSAIREQIMARKVRFSITTCWYCWYRTIGFGYRKRIPCVRLTLLAGGRYYHHWICLRCQRRIWGTTIARIRVRRRLPGLWSGEPAQVKW